MEDLMIQMMEGNQGMMVHEAIDEQSTTIDCDLCGTDYFVGVDHEPLCEKLRSERKKAADRIKMMNKKGKSTNKHSGAYVQQNHRAARRGR